MNSVNLVGRITKDLELRKTQSGESFLYFTVAVNRTFTNKDGQREADFINCVAWRRQAENMATYIGKGSLISVDGRISTRSYEQNGQRVFVTEVVAENVQFLESRNANQSSGASYSQPTPPPAQPNMNQQNNDFFADFNQNNNSSQDILSGLDISDDELPF